MKSLARISFDIKVAKKFINAARMRKAMLLRNHFNENPKHFDKADAISEDIQRNLTSLTKIYSCHCLKWK